VCCIVAPSCRATRPRRGNLVSRSRPLAITVVRASSTAVRLAATKPSSGCIYAFCSLAVLTLFSHTGPSAQTLRNVPSNMFQTQQNANRGAALGTNRLQNGKMGEEHWNHIAGPHADDTCDRGRIAVGIWRSNGRRARPDEHANTDKRCGHVKLCASYERLTASHSPESRVSFPSIMAKKKPRAKTRRSRRDSMDAQVVDEFKLNVGDRREFPSLSGAPQAQQNTSAQQMWANPTLRTATQQQTIGRPQGQGPQQGPAGQAANPQLQNQGQEDAVPNQFSGPGDDYRFGGQGGVGQLSGSAQPQTTNIEEFPPLGGAAGEIGPDRRAGLIQNAAAFGSNANASAFPGLGQTRNGLSSPTDSQQERTLNPTVGGRNLPGAGS
jgi:hypothetical protein